MSCSDMIVSNTEIKGGDDGLALKVYARNITFINGVYWSTTCNAVIFGSESFDEFIDVNIINATILSAGKGGISIESMDGGIYNNIVIQNIYMSNITIPIWIKIGNRNGINPGKISNLLIDNITAVNTIGYRGNFTSTIVGLMDAYIGPNITLSSINIMYKGGGILNDTYICPYNDPIQYNPRTYGVRPSYGFDIQNAYDIHFIDIQLSFEINDDRPAFAFSNTNNCSIISSNAETGISSIGDIIKRGTKNFVLLNSNLNAVVLPACQQ